MNIKNEMKILIIGSSNTDMVVYTWELPIPGETVLGGKFMMNTGGKGANQAVAAARLGGSVGLIAKLGNDLFGKHTITKLQQEGINTDSLLIDPVNPSGVALINVDRKGENTIVVASGANMAITTEEIVQLKAAISQASIILMQLEIPLSVVKAAAKIAFELGKTVILNPAPACSLPEELFQYFSILTPNQIEAQRITGIKVDSLENAEQAARQIFQMGVANVIITLGKEGAYLYNQHTAQLIPSVPVEAVDTTAAGDTFNGALAVALSQGKELVTAITFANLAASVTVTRQGAQSSLPYMDELSLTN